MLGTISIRGDWDVQPPTSCDGRDSGVTLINFTVCGEDHVGLGTDGSISGVPLTDAYREHFKKDIEARIKAGYGAPGESADVLTIVPEYNDPLRFYSLANDLARRGWSGNRIDKLLGANFTRLFAEVWGA